MDSAFLQSLNLKNSTASPVLPNTRSLFETPSPLSDLTNNASSRGSAYSVLPSKRPSPQLTAPTPANTELSPDLHEQARELMMKLQDVMTQIHHNNVIPSLPTQPQQMNQFTVPQVPEPQQQQQPQRSVLPEWGYQEPVTQSPITVALVEFKRQRVRRYDSQISVSPGNYVIVEGDRGIDCGLVVQTWTTGPDGSTQHACIEGVNVEQSKVKAESGRVLRIANQTETSALHGEIATLEHHALKTCREKVMEYGLNITLLDCEFQFDKKKITFYFDSNQAIDFRNLVRELYKIFGARIWMENVNSKVRNTAPPGALSNTEKQALGITRPQVGGGRGRGVAPSISPSGRRDLSMSDPTISTMQAFMPAGRGMYN